MELEFFIRPDEAVELICGHVATLADNPDLGGEPQEDWGWEVWHKYWVERRLEWYRLAGLPESDLHLYWQTKEELAHYARACVDIEYAFPFGVQELEGIAARSNFDLSQHEKFSGKSMTVQDDRLRLACAEKSDEEKAAFKAKVVADWVARGKTQFDAEAFVDLLFQGKYVPHVIEPSAGTDRLALALICNAYDEEKLVDAKGKEDVRTVLRFSPAIAPVKVAVLPLVKNNEALRAKARELYKALQRKWKCAWDETGAIGRRYRRQDEIGTPFCVTVDFETLGEEKPELKDTVTVRLRDSMEQLRMPIAELVPYIEKAILL